MDQPAIRTGFGDKIAVYFYGAFSPESDGCHARVCSLVDRLHGQFPGVTVYSYDNHPDFPWKPANFEAFRARWPRAELILEPYTARLKWLTRAKNLLISLFPGKADRFIRFSMRGWSPQFDRLKPQIGGIFVNYTHGLAQLNGIEPAHCLVDTHDINFAKWAKMTRSSAVSLASLRKLRGEVAALQTVGAVVAISPSEAAFFRMMLVGNSVSYVSTWEAQGHEQARISAQAPDIDLVFFGSGYVMNARGLCEMLEAHGAWLSRYRIAVCGYVCEDPSVIAAARQFPNVTLLGYVEHPETIYARSKAALSPVDGTGLKMKIVAALRAGLPAFATKQAFDGLPPGYEGAVLPLTETSVTHVLDNQQRLAAARDAALIYYDSFNRSAEADALLERLKSPGGLAAAS